MIERLHFHFSFSCIGEGNGNPLQCSCLENSRDGGAWWAAIYGVAQSQTRLKQLSSSSSRNNLPKGFQGDLDGKESVFIVWVWSLGWEGPLEEGMSTHSSILAWRIPWTEEHDGLPSMGLQRVGPVSLWETKHNLPKGHSRWESTLLTKKWPFAFLYRSETLPPLEYQLYLFITYSLIKSTPPIQSLQNKNNN